MRNQPVSTEVEMANEKQKEGIRATVGSALGSIFEELTKEDAQAMLGAQGEIVKGVQAVFQPFIKTIPVRAQSSLWTQFYKEVFGLDSDFSKLRVPRQREDFGQLLIADERVTAQMAFDKCVERFGAWKYASGSLDDVVPVNDRNGTYAVWHRGGLEPDEIHLNKSANELKGAKVANMTLRERLILELFHEWRNSGQHLDVKGCTLCAGSRDVDGSVPYVIWDSDSRKLFVYWCHASGRRSSVGCREVVS